jgi:hypothetical protein
MESGMARRGCGKAQAEAPAQPAPGGKEARGYSRIGFTYFELPVPSEKGWRKIEECLGLASPDDGIRAEIEHQVGLYLAEGAPLGSTPRYVRPKIMAKRLGAIDRAARKLRKLLAVEGRDDRKHHEARSVLGRLREQQGGLLALDALPQILEAIEAGAQAAEMQVVRDEEIRHLQVRGALPRSDRGRRSNRAFDYLIARLADLFEQQSGLSAIVDRFALESSDFFWFVSAVSAHLPARPSMKTKTLGWAVCRALERRLQATRQNSRALAEF